MEELEVIVLLLLTTVYVTLYQSASLKVVYLFRLFVGSSFALLFISLLL